MTDFWEICNPYRKFIDGILRRLNENLKLEETEKDIEFIRELNLSLVVSYFISNI